MKRTIELIIGFLLKSDMEQRKQIKSRVSRCLSMWIGITVLFLFSTEAFGMDLFISPPTGATMPPVVNPGIQFSPPQDLVPITNIVPAPSIPGKVDNNFHMDGIIKLINSGGSQGFNPGEHPFGYTSNPGQFGYTPIIIPVVNPGQFQPAPPPLAPLDLVPIPNSTPKLAPTPEEKVAEVNRLKRVQYAQQSRLPIIMQAQLLQQQAFSQLQKLQLSQQQFAIRQAAQQQQQLIQQQQQEP
ncbi:MAG: hypothetical protein WC680_08580 [Sulfuricurvum sp.]|jgi:hypothetical protein